jgi:hypothetical protein
VRALLLLALTFSLAEAVAPGAVVGEPGSTALTPIFVGKMGEGGGNFVSPDFVLRDDGLLVMITFGVEDAFDVSKMVPQHNLGGVFTERLTLYLTGSSHVAAKVWTIPVAKGARGAAGFGYQGGQSVKGRILMLFAITGHNAASPIGLTVTAPAIGDGDGAMALPGKPDARSIVVAGRILDVDAKQDAAAVPGKGWTAIGDESIFERAGLQVQYRIGGGSPAIAWGAVNANKATNQQCGGFAIEIKSR